MNPFIKLAGVAVLMVYSISCTSAEPETLKLTVSYDRKNSRFEVTLTNVSSTPICIVDRINPKWGVVRFHLKNKQMKDVDIVSGYADWEIKGSDVLTLKPAEVLTRSVDVEEKVPPGEYTLTVEYNLQPDSFFIENWTKGAHTSKGKGYADERRKIATLWAGSAKAVELNLAVPEK